MPPSQDRITLAAVVAERPFPAFAQWWQMGEFFIQFMSTAICTSWQEHDGTEKGMNQVRAFTAEYLQLVYDRMPDLALVDDFTQQNISRTFYSGEMDALSYAFYRSIFESLAERWIGDIDVVADQRRRFTRQVGVEFFAQVHDHLQLNLPPDLRTPEHFHQLQTNLNQLGSFLLEQGYLRDAFEFTFTLDEIKAGKRIHQQAAEFLDHLHTNGFGYALYIMGYPVILPSAVYLYRLFGEAQHHSSRMIEELFARIGYQAREADDFDPSSYPADKVVELWSISL